MIKFTEEENYKQYVSIAIHGKTNTQDVLNYISKVYPTIDPAFCRMDKKEILFALEQNIRYGFSLNELCSTVKQIADATVSYVIVDMALKGQRRRRLCHRVYKGITEGC